MKPSGEMEVVFFSNVTKTNLQTYTHFHRTKIEPTSEPKCLEESCRRKSASQGTNSPWPGSANQLNADLTALWIPTWAGQRIITAFSAEVHWSQEPWGRFTSCSENFPPSVLVVVPQHRPSPPLGFHSAFSALHQVRRDLSTTFKPF